MLPSNSSITHFVDNTNNLPFFCLFDWNGKLNNREKKTMINSLRLFLNSERLTIFMSISSGSILSLFCGNEFAVSEGTRIEHVLTICCQKHSNFIPIEWGEVYITVRQYLFLNQLSYNPEKKKEKKRGRLLTVSRGVGRISTFVSTFFPLFNTLRS